MALDLDPSPSLATEGRRTPWSIQPWLASLVPLSCLLPAPEPLRNGSTTTDWVRVLAAKPWLNPCPTRVTNGLRKAPTHAVGTRTFAEERALSDAIELAGAEPSVLNASYRESPGRASKVIHVHREGLGDCLHAASLAHC